MEKAPKNVILTCLVIAVILIVLMAILFIMLRVPVSEDTTDNQPAPQAQTMPETQSPWIGLLASPAYAQPEEALKRLAGVSLDSTEPLPCPVVCQIANARQNWNRHYSEIARFDDWHYLGKAELDQEALANFEEQLSSGEAPEWFNELGGNALTLALLVNEIAAEEGLLMPSLSLTRIKQPPPQDPAQFTVAGNLAYLPAAVAATTLKEPTSQIALLTTTRGEFPVLDNSRILDEARVFKLPAAQDTGTPIIEVSGLEPMLVHRFEILPELLEGTIHPVVAPAGETETETETENDGGRITVRRPAAGEIGEIAASPHSFGRQPAEIAEAGFAISAAADLSSVYVIELSWLAGGQRRSTLCLADKGGILYDSMLSNVALAQFEDGSFSLRFGWPWESPGGPGSPGYTRGYIRVDAQLSDSSTSPVWEVKADSNFTLGEAKVSIDSKSPTADGGVLVEYSYAWATGFKSIQLSISGSGFQVVGALGSGGVGQGSFVEP